MFIEDPVATAAPTATRLLGRTTELDALRAVVSGVAGSGATGSGDALLLSGEAGVGKTALLGAALEQAGDDRTTVLSVSGVESLPGPAHSALLRALRPLDHLMPLLSAAQRDALDGVRSRATAPSHPLRVPGAVLALLRAAASDRPVLLVVDDLQWVDEASAVAFAFAARRLAGSRVRFLAAVRTGAAGVFDRAGVPEHEVAPLDELASARLLRRRFPRLAPRVARRLLAEAHGNPLALAELPAALTEPQRTAVSALPAVLPLRPGLRALYGPRLAALPASTRRPLLLAALEGTGDLDTVAAVAGEAGLDRLAPAERAGLVTVDRGARRVEFRHPLVRSTIVDGASLPERRRAHRALADGLPHDAERRTRHLADAAGGPDEDVARLVERTAHRALRTGDGVGAVSGLLRAVDLSAPGPERGRRLAEAACVGASVTGDLDRVRPLLAELDACDPTGPASLSSAVAAAWLRLHGDGDVVGTQRLLVEALEAGRTGDATPAGVVDEALHTALEACLHGAHPEQWQRLRAVSARRGDAFPDLQLLMAVLADPARVTANVVEQLDREIGGLWNGDGSHADRPDRRSGARRRPELGLPGGVVAGGRERPRGRGRDLGHQGHLRAVCRRLRHRSVGRVRPAGRRGHRDVHEARLPPARGSAPPRPGPRGRRPGGPRDGRRSPRRGGRSDRSRR